VFAWYFTSFEWKINGTKLSRGKLFIEWEGKVTIFIGVAFSESAAVVALFYNAGCLIQFLLTTSTKIKKPMDSFRYGKTHNFFNDN
jgi:hypothetical protein